MAGNNNAATASTDRELVITRTFDAPRRRVYESWVEPGRMGRWSSPRGFSITQQEGDVRPGGRWRVRMHSPDGEDLGLGGVYREVVENERLVFTHAWDGANGKPGHETEVTVTFEDIGDKTRMTFRQGAFDSKETRDGHAGGWTEAFDKLAEDLSARAR